MSDVSLSWFAHGTPVFPTYSKYMEIRFVLFFLSSCELFLSVSMSKTVIRLHVLSKVYPVSSHDTGYTWFKNMMHHLKTTIRS